MVLLSFIVVDFVINNPQVLCQLIFKIAQVSNIIDFLNLSIHLINAFLKSIL